MISIMSIKNLFLPCKSTKSHPKSASASVTFAVNIPLYFQLKHQDSQQKLGKLNLNTL